MRRISTMVLSVLLAIAVTLPLHIPRFVAAYVGQLNIADLGAEEGSVDELYYFALLREGADGHWAMGNTSFRAHADTPSLISAAVVPQAALVALGIPLTTVIMLGDVVFPLIIAVLYFFLALAVGARMMNAALFVVVTMMYWGLGWLRVINPQVTMTIFLTALLLFVSDRQCRAPWRRGCALGVLLLVQPIHAVLVFSAEVLDACRALLVSSFRVVLRMRAPIIVFPAVVGIGIVIVSMVGDASVTMDTSFRRGLILSHFPANPFLQSLVVLTLAAWLFALWRRRVRFADAALFLVLLGACLLVLNQSMFHGRDAVFALYYRMPIGAVVSLSILSLAHALGYRRLSTVVLVAMLVFLIPSYVGELRHSPSYERGRALERSDLLSVLGVVDTLPGERVVLAPLPLSDLVPVLTRHTAFFTQYARYEMVTDAELAERYLAQAALFPFPPETLLEGFPLVFGIGAGNRYARHKIFCSLLDRSGWHDDRCQEFQLSDFIQHQDLRQFVERGTIDPLPIFRTYGVDTILTSDPLPDALSTQCSLMDSVHGYHVYECRFGGWSGES